MGNLVISNFPLIFLRGYPVNPLWINRFVLKLFRFKFVNINLTDLFFRLKKSFLLKTYGKFWQKYSCFKNIKKVIAFW